MVTAEHACPIAAPSSASEHQMPSQPAASMSSTTPSARPHCLCTCVSRRAPDQPDIALRSHRVQRAHSVEKKSPVGSSIISPIGRMPSLAPPGSAATPCTNSSRRCGWCIITKGQSRMLISARPRQPRRSRAWVRRKAVMRSSSATGKAPSQSTDASSRSISMIGLGTPNSSILRIATGTQSSPQRILPSAVTESLSSVKAK
mmetsp:Transcript_27759/g.93287  ORF Transcript_27759/g.93287 Transcript_27759/m.93287 type:complete len:202 (+) Transcript_27759:1027-1632(+)